MARADISTRVLVRIRLSKIALNRAVSRFRTGIHCRLWKVVLGRDVIFHGMPLIYRTPESTLSIADNCQFLSTPDSNLAGINRPCYLSTLLPGAELRLGVGCGLSGTVIAAAFSVTLGKGVFCGANTTIVDTDFHHVDPLRRLDSRDIPAAPVVIEDNVWLGMGCIVLKGVTIGRDSVIAAGSVVVSNIPARVIAGGIPARVLRSLDAPKG